MIERLLDILTMQLVRVRGDSMAPALRLGSWALFSRRALRDGRGPRRFDIVRFEDPSRAGWSVKRVAGLPGEDVRLENGALYIDGRPVSEPHASPVDGPEWLEWRPGPGEYVVLGDNRARSTDSRRYGCVPAAALRGRLVRRLGR